MKSIKDLIDWNLKSTKNNGENESRFVFRGVSDKDYLLIPKIYRNKESLNPIKNPNNRINRLRAYLKIHLSDYGFDLNKYKKKDKEWYELFLAQHYGAPTNLLDFTRNPLVAAFFACKNQQDKDAKVYAIKIKEHNWENDFNPKSLEYNIATYDLLSKKYSPYNLDRPIFVVPPMIDKRIQSQIGLFCCFPLTEPKPLEKYTGFMNKSKESEGYIKEFTIKSENKVKILDELNKIGINDKTLFPDMSGFGEFVNWKLSNL